MRFFIAVFALLFASGVHAAPNGKSIDAFVDEELPATGASGLAFAIVDKGQVRTGAFGTTKAGGQVPVTTSTPFAIGSISKSFTAIAIVQLAEAGLLDLDAPVATYLDAFQDRTSGSISLRQLLSHTSGYSTVQGNFSHGLAGSERTSLGDYIAMASRWETANAPGTSWEYSNLNYQVLGGVIEEVSGEDYASYVATNILEPLGMNDSFVFTGATPANAAVGHRPWFAGTRPFRGDQSSRINAPAGGIFASAADMALYLEMMLSDEDGIISAAHKAEMLRPASDAVPYYGLGWFLDGEEGLAFHTGLVPGTEATVTLHPVDAKGAVVIVNANGGLGFADNQHLRNGVTALALGMKVPSRNAFVGPKTTYLSVVLLPLLFVICIAWAWIARRSLAAKSGMSGLASLWFPLGTMAALSAVLLFIVPRMFGGSLETLGLYQPDFALALIASAILGPAWALSRLAIAYWTKARKAK